MNSKFKWAFTMVELLVVIAIIALLGLLLLPVLAHAKASARRTVCAGNLHQINLAAHMYADDHRDAIRAMTNKEAIYFTYKENLQPYLSRLASNAEMSVFACPADDFNCDDHVLMDLLLEHGSGKGFCRQEFTHHSSYFFNGAAPGETPSLQHMGQKPFASVRYPSRVVLVGELSGALGLSTHERKEPYQFNNAQNVMSFVDGHVSFIRIYWNGVNGIDGLAYFYEPPSGYDYQWSGN